MNGKLYQKHSILFVFCLGTYVCRDKQIITVLNKYKLKEGIYKETIKTLEENNRVILEDVLNLREMIFASITK